MNDYRHMRCGLLAIVEDEKWGKSIFKKPIPLVSVEVNAFVVESVAKVEVTQVYENKQEHPIEAIYYFPVDPEGAINHFEAQVEGKIVKGIVKPHVEAKEAYDKAVQNRTTAFLGEETKADIFKVRVGFLKPGTQAKLIIVYVAEVKNDPGSKNTRFYIPTHVAPRYVSPKETDDKAQEMKTMKFSQLSIYPKLSIKVDVSMQGGIKSVNSPTHAIKIEKPDPYLHNKILQDAVVKFSGDVTDMDRDFVLEIVPEGAHQPQLYYEKMENGSTAMMLSFVPSFKLGEQKSEILFVLDRSGSMTGPSIDLAREALMVFLHSMPVDCYFNVIGFGSTFKSLFPCSVKYNDASLNEAVSYAKSLEADLGGTEILEPFKWIYGKTDIDGYLRQIFILTDGEVSNTDSVLGIAQANAHKARVFALGIGNGVSHHLIEGIAKAGGGTCAFVTQNESICEKVLNQMKNALQSSLTEVELQWQGLDEQVPINKDKTLLGYNKPVEKYGTSKQSSINDNKKIKQSPKKIPPVFDGSQLLVFGLFKDEMPNGVTITAQSPDGPLSIKVELSLESNVGSTGLLHGLAAIKLVRELELEEAALQFQGLEDTSKLEEGLKRDIIEIGCQNGITSKYTSFVAIDTNDNKPSDENWITETRNVPSSIAHKWHGGQRTFYDAVDSPGQTDSSDSFDEADCIIWPYSVEPLTLVMEVITLQSFDGSYKLNEKLCSILQHNLQDLQIVAIDDNIQESVLATALATSYFKTELKIHKNRWDLVVLKAEKWLKKQLSDDKLKYVVQLAIELLKK